MARVLLATQGVRAWGQEDPGGGWEVGWPDQVWSGFLNFFFFPRIWKPQGWTSPFLRTAGQTVGSWRSWGLGRSSLGEVGGAVLGIVPTSILTLGDHLFFGFFFPGVCLGPLEQV